MAGTGTLTCTGGSLLADSPTGVISATGGGEQTGTVLVPCFVDLGLRLPGLEDGRPPEVGSKSADKLHALSFSLDVEILAECKAVDGGEGRRRRAASASAGQGPHITHLVLGWAAEGSGALDGVEDRGIGCSLDSWGFDVINERLLHQARPGEAAAGAAAEASASTGGAPPLMPMDSSAKASTAARPGSSSSGSPCGCSGSACTPQLCSTDVKVSAEGYRLARHARRGKPFGTVLRVRDGSIGFSAGKSYGGDAFRRVGHDRARGAGRRIVPAVFLRATIPPGAAGSVPLIRVRAGGPSSWAAPSVLRSVSAVPVGWVAQLEAVAAEHAAFRDAEAEAGPVPLDRAGSGLSRHWSVNSERSADGAVQGGDAAPETPLHGSGGGFVSPPSASASVGGPAGADPPGAPASAASAGAAAAAAEDEGPVLGDDMMEPEMSDLQRPVAAQLWEAIVSTTESDEATASRITDIVFGIMGGDNTVLTGRPHPIQGETETSTPSHRRGESLLHAAAAAGKTGTARLLVTMSAGLVNPNAPCREGSRATPLHLAVEAGHEEMVAFLVSPQGGAAASAATKDQEGRTPVALAVLSDAQGILAVMKRAGVSVEEEAVDGNTGLHTACTSGNVRRICAAVDAATDEALTAENDNGDTPLRLATAHLNGADLAQVLKAFARRCPEEIARMCGEGEPPVHALVPMLAGAGPLGRWDVTSCKSNGAAPIVSADGLTVRFNSSNAVIPLSSGVVAGGRLSFRVRLERENKGDETSVVGFVRNGPETHSYGGIGGKRHLFYRPYNGEIKLDGAGESTGAKVGKTHPKQTVLLTLDLTGPEGRLFVATHSDKRQVLVARGIAFGPDDTFYPALACYGNRKQELRLLGVGREDPRHAAEAIGSYIDAARIGTAAGDLGPEAALSLNEVRLLGSPAAQQAAAAALKRETRVVGVGSLVKVRDGVAPKFGMGGTSHGSVGVVTELVTEHKGGCHVDFPEHPGWTGLLAELELTTLGGTPVGAAGPMASRVAASIGTAVLGLKVGSTVRLRPGVTPTTGWGGVTAASVGTVKEFTHEDKRCTVNFPEHKDWKGVVSELQVVDAHGRSASDIVLACYGLRQGGRVRVRPGVEPRFNWGGVSAHSVGVLTGVTTMGRCEVAFPENPSWKALWSELVAVDDEGAPVPETASQRLLARAVLGVPVGGSSPDGGSGGAGEASSASAGGSAVPLSAVLSTVDDGGGHGGLVAPIADALGGAESTDSAGKTLLHRLAELERLRMPDVSFLLEHGVDPMAHDAAGRPAVRYGTDALAEMLLQLHAVRVEGVMDMDRDQQGPVEGTFSAVRFAPREAAVLDSSDSDSDAGVSAAEAARARLGPDRWFDQVITFATPSGDDGSARFAAWPRPKAGDVIPAKTPVVAGPDVHGDARFAPGALAEALTVTADSAAVVRMADGTTATFALTSDRQEVRPVELDPVTLAGPAAFPKKTAIMDIELRYRERNATRDARMLAPGMFVVRGPTWAAGGADGGGPGWILAVGETPEDAGAPTAVTVQWQAGTGAHECRVGGPEGLADVVVIDVDPTSDAAVFLASGARIDLETMRMYVAGHLLCYSPDGPARIGAARGRWEAAQAAAGAAPGALGAASSASAGGAAAASATAAAAEPRPSEYGLRTLPAELVFDPALRPGLPEGAVTVEEDGCVATSTVDSAVVLARVPLTPGSAYRLVMIPTEDKAGNMCTCYGVGLHGGSGHSYSSAEGTWLYRAHTGDVYGSGKVDAHSKLKVAPGDAVTIHLDLRPGFGTITYEINGKSAGVCFRGLPTSGAQALFPAVAFYGTKRSVRLVSVSRVSTVRAPATLELRSSSLVPGASCSRCGLPIRSPDAWLDMEHWCGVSARFAAARLRAMRAAESACRNRSAVATVEEDRSMLPAHGYVVTGVDTDDLVVTVQREDDPGSPHVRVDPYALIDLGRDQRFASAPVRFLRPQKDTCRAVCPGCFRAACKTVRVALAEVNPVVTAVARSAGQALAASDAAAAPPDGDAAPDGGNSGGGNSTAARALLRHILLSPAADGTTLLHDCTAAGMFGWLHAAVEAAGLRRELLELEPSLLALAASHVPVPASAGDDDGPDGDVSSDDDDDDGDAPGVEAPGAKHFLKRLGQTQPATALSRVLSLGQLGGGAVGHEPPQSMPLNPDALHALVVLPPRAKRLGEKAPPSEGGLSAWVSLRLLVEAFASGQFKAASESSGGPAVPALTPNQWLRAGGRELVLFPSGPAMSTAEYLLELAGAPGKGASAGPSAAFLVAASHLLRACVLAQLSGRVAVLDGLGARLEDSVDDRGRSPLHIVCAAPVPSVSVVERLLGLGASAIAPDASGATAIHYAARCASDEDAAAVLRRLLASLRPRGGADSGAGGPADDPDDAPEDDDGILLLAGREGKEAVGGAVNAHDSKGRRPVHLAAAVGCCDSVELLVDCGAALQHDGDAVPPLHTAVAAGHPHVVRLLLDMGADIQACDAARSDTALHIAAKERGRAMVALLLERGARPGQVNRAGESAMDLARRMEAHDVLGQLHEARETLERPDGGTGSAAALASMVGDRLIDPKDVTLGRMLGEGGFGVVLEAELTHRPGTKVVVKQLKTVTRLDGPLREMLFQEVTAMRLACSMPHPAVLQFIGLVAQDDGVSANGMPLAYGLVLEHAAGGSMRPLLERPDVASELPLVKRLSLLADVASGLAFLHKKTSVKPAIAHRDLKPDNILLDATHSKAIISDFGLSKVRDVAERTSKTTKFATTMQYRAPEAWKQKKPRKRGGRRGPADAPPAEAAEAGAGGVGEDGLTLRDRRLVAQDVFSLGVMIWEIATLRPPYANDCNIADIHQDIVVDQMPPGPVWETEDELADDEGGVGEGPDSGLEGGGNAAAGAATGDSVDAGVDRDDVADIEWLESAECQAPDARLTEQWASAGQTGTRESDASFGGGALGADDSGWYDDEEEEGDIYGGLFGPEDFAAAQALPRSLRRLIAECCAASPDDRPACGDVAKELRRLHICVQKQVDAMNGVAQEEAAQAPSGQAPSTDGYAVFHE